MMNVKTPLALVLGVVIGSAATFFINNNVPGQAESKAVLVMDGTQYTLEDIPPAAARAVFEADREAWYRKVQIISGAAGEMFVQKQINDSGRDRQEVLVDVLGLNIPSEKDIDDFYEQNKERIPAPLEQVREQIRNYLVGQDLQAKRNLLTERLKSEQGMKVLLQKPEAPLTVIDTKGFPVKGNPSAKITLVKFADYQCPHCAVSAETLDKLMEEIGDRVKMVYMDFPINSSGVSRDVALGSVCADEQGKYWEYNQLAFRQQNSLNEESKINLAKELGLDMDAYNTCLASSKPEQRIAKAESEAERLGLTGTPAFFVNGQGLQPEDLEKGLVEAVKEAAGLN